MKEIYEGFKSRKDLERQFNIKLDSFIKIIYAYKNSDAFVLFEKNGLLYEVNATRSSYDEIENQWDPEETSIEYLEKFNYPEYVSAVNIYKDYINE